MVKFDLPPGKKIFFASDFHLGAPNHDDSKSREVRVVQWLDQIKEEASAILLLGDIFDFWFDYKYVVPRGYVRFLGKIRELGDMGIEVIFFTGNHDMWMFDYFPSELGVQVFYDPVTIEVGPKRLKVGHGDGLGQGEYVYKTIRHLFRNRFCQGVFAFLHPYLGISIARFWSKTSRENHDDADHLDRDQERLYNFCQKEELKEHHDLYIFGHRHLPLEMPLGPTSWYYNVGDWVTHSKFGVFDSEGFSLREFAG